LQTLATAHRAAGRALQNLPFAVKVGLASCVLVVASLVVVWMHDAGFRDRLYRTVTGYRRPSDARFDLARGGQCVDGCASGGARQGGCIPRDVHVTYNSRGVLRHHRILESALSPGYVCRLASLALPPPPQAAAAPPPVAETTSTTTATGSSSTATSSGDHLSANLLGQTAGRSLVVASVRPALCHKPLLGLFLGTRSKQPTELRPILGQPAAALSWAASPGGTCSGVSVW
jgi:hypothetical protein